jgi:hypothetical protein
MVESNGRKPRRPARSGAGTVSHPDLEWRETVKSTKPGDRFVRIATHRAFYSSRPRPPGPAGGDRCADQLPLRLKAALLFHPGVVVTNVPYHMATRLAT